MAYDTHQDIDFLRLEGHRLIAEKLRQNHLPIIQEAKTRILKKGSPITLAWQEWWDHFEQLPIDKLIEWISQDTEAGQRIRQSSPLAFCLSKPERDALISYAQNGTGAFTASH